MKYCIRFLQWICVGFCLLAAPRSGLSAGFALNPGDILAANYGGNSVIKIDAANGNVQSLGDFSTPTDVALAPNGDLYIAEWGGFVYRLTLTNGVLELINPDTTMYSVWGLVIAPNGDLIVTCGANDTIVRVNPVTGAETVISETNQLYGVSGIALLDAQHVVVCSTFNNQLVSVALAGGAQTVVPTSAGGIDRPRGVAVFGGEIFMTAYDSREIRRVPIGGGTVTTFFTATGFPFGMSVETNGNVVTGTSGAAFEVLRVSPAGSLLTSFTDPLISEVTGVEVSRIAVTPPVTTNTPPVLDPIANYTVSETNLLSFQAAATDTDWPPQTLTFTLEPGAPAGAVISSIGLFSWIPTEAQGPGSYPVTVKVTDDGTPPRSATATLTVVVNEVNSPPAIGTIPDQTVIELTQLAFTVTAADPDLPAQSVSFSLEPGAPPGASITPQGAFAWTPTLSQGPASYVIGVRATDNGSPPLSATRSFNVQVFEGNQPPVPGTNHLERFAYGGGKVRKALVLGTDPEGDPLSVLSVDAASAGGGAVATNQDWIIYTPPAGFTNADSFTYRVGDGRGGIGTGVMLVDVKPDLEPSQNVVTTDLGNGSVRVRVSGIPGRACAIQYRTDLLSTAWQLLVTTNTDANGVIELIDTPPGGSPPRFYRSVFQ